MVNNKNNNFINSLRTMNEENLIYHLKNIKHTPVEIHILKKRLVEIRNNKKIKMREVIMKKKIMEQNETIKQQQTELMNQQIRFQYQLLKEQNRQLSMNLIQQQQQQNVFRNDNYTNFNQNINNYKNNKYAIDRPISSISLNRQNKNMDILGVIPSKQHLNNSNMKIDFVSHPVLTKMPKGQEKELQHPSLVKITQNFDGDHPSMINRSTYNVHKKINGQDFEKFQRQRQLDIEQIYGKQLQQPQQNINKFHVQVEEEENEEDNIDYIKQLIAKKKEKEEDNSDLIKKLDRINFLVNKINSK